MHFLGEITRNNMLKYSYMCEVGICFISKHSDNINERCLIGVSNKPFDYLACGLVLLAVIYPSG